jgi:hypothetical protein
LRELARCHQVVIDLNDCPLGVHDAKIDYRIHLDRDIVMGNHVLGRHFVDDDAEINADHLLDQRHKQEKSGPFVPV